MVLMLEIVLTILRRKAIYVKLLGTRELCPSCVDIRHSSVARWSFGRGSADPEPSRDFDIFAAIVAVIAATATVAAVSGIALSQSGVKASTVEKPSREVADNWEF